ncbi:galactose-specific lectin nattectin-like [Scomber japonicus]|uniref:galactose-specific lectin nattectin-like n=1 Tax=Scomber japonicus TaxID=13676 RepID=UPI002306376F|nr:galactose-specific lectin nattectin-like [Scomber japonicus]
MSPAVESSLSAAPSLSNMLSMGRVVEVTQSATDNSDEQVSRCPSGWTQFGSRCFIFHRHGRTWNDAENLCISIGGNLASIHSADENAFLSDLIFRVSGHRHHTWIGGYDAVKEGTWLWSDGSKFNYFRWYLREPNNHGGRENCIEMNFGGTSADILTAF